MERGRCDGRKSLEHETLTVLCNNLVDRLRLCGTLQSTQDRSMYDDRHAATVC